MDNLTVTRACGCTHKMDAIAVKVVGEQALRTRLEASLCGDCESKASAARVVSGYVIGNTYSHRKTLKALGMRWDAGHHAWVGRVDPHDLPTGCRLATKAEAALRSMDHDGSAY